TEIDSTRIDWPSRIDALPNPYEYKDPASESRATDNATNVVAGTTADTASPARIIPMPLHRKSELDKTTTYIRLPSFNKVKNDPALYAHASRVLHQESNPHNARVLVQKHDTKEVWVNA